MQSTESRFVTGPEIFRLQAYMFFLWLFSPEIVQAVAVWRGSVRVAGNMKTPFSLFCLFWGGNRNLSKHKENIQYRLKVCARACVCVCVCVCWGWGCLKKKKTLWKLELTLNWELTCFLFSECPPSCAVLDFPVCIFSLVAPARPRNPASASGSLWQRSVGYTESRKMMVWAL